MRNTLFTLATELREFPRVLYSGSVQLFTPAEGGSGTGELIMSAICYDLSRGGIRVFSTHPLNVDRLIVQFSTVRGEEITQSAHVLRRVHRDEWMWEHGLEFDTPLPESVILEMYGTNF